MDHCPKVFLADNHSLLAEGIKCLLYQEKEFQLCAEAFSGQELLQSLNKQPVDCLILNLNLNDLPIQQLISAIFEITPKLPILVISRALERQIMLDLIHLGVLGFISLDCRKFEFLNALSRVRQGHCYLAPELSDLFVHCLKNTKAQQAFASQDLSKRERQIFPLLAQGKKIQDIAEQLYLSQNTVRTYRNRLMNKLDLKNHTQLVKYALEHHLI